MRLLLGAVAVVGTMLVQSPALAFSKCTLKMPRSDWRTVGVGSSRRFVCKAASCEVNSEVFFKFDRRNLGSGYVAALKRSGKQIGPAIPGNKSRAGSGKRKKDGKSMVWEMHYEDDVFGAAVILESFANDRSTAAKNLRTARSRLQCR